MEEKKLKVSFRQKNPIICPVCNNEIFREELMSGGGRLIAGKLTDELRRCYEKNVKYGKIYPMAYMLNVCPRCLYTAYPKDFENLQADELDKIRGASQARVNTIKKFFGDLDFTNDRTLKHGAASFMLAVDVYNFRNKHVAPTFKKAVSSIRAAWLFADLAEEFPDKQFKKISDFFYSKTYIYYQAVLELLTNGKEPAEAAGNMGPDSDKNWGYDGILYLYASLTMKIGAKEPDLKKRIENVDRTKRYLSRIFGMGKASKDKPGQILEMTKDLYDTMNTLLEQWNKQLAAESEVPLKEE